MADCVAKGRRIGQGAGEKNAAAKLTQTTVDSIRARFTGARGEKAAFAREFGVCASTIGAVLSGEHWS